MEKPSKSTISNKKEIPIRKPTSKTATKVDAAKLNEKPNKIVKSKTAVSVTNKPKPATTTQPKPSKAVVQQKTISKDAVNANKIMKNEKLSNQTRAKNVPLKSEALQRKSLPSKVAIKNVKPNAVLDTFHNVTVASPPAKRKNKTSEIEISEKIPDTSSNPKHARSNTRTLEPDEVVVLRNESAKRRIQAEIQAETNTETPKIVKESIAFEVEFNENSKASYQKRENTQIEQTSSNDEVEANYSDDFESYESDFESGSVSPTTDTEEDNFADIQNEVPEHEDDSESETRDEENEDEESELTQNPVTVIQRDKYVERKLDSGHYEMNLRTQDNSGDAFLQTNQQTFDSLDTFSGATSEQLDSGLSSYRIATNKMKMEHKEESIVSVYGGYKDFLSRPILTTRGVELMSKIKFDTLTFALFELKPISYDIYMQTYGKLNTTQSFTQTNDNYTTSDVQTDDCEMRSKWTQHPPKYDIQTIQMLKTQINSLNCCGELQEQNDKSSVENDNLFGDLNDLPSLQTNRNANKELHISRKPIDFNRLQTFLTYSSNLMLKVLNLKNNCNKIENTFKPASNGKPGLSKGYYQLDTNFLNALRVVHIFANCKHNLVITVHESLPEADVYRSDFSNLLMVWSTNDRTKPLRLLSTWSEVCRAEICSDMQDIVVCGLRDGSVAMWDLRETYSFCSKLDGYLTHFAATQSVAPIWNANNAGTDIMDLGAVVDIRSFESRRKGENLLNTANNFKTIQFTSLNDSGILVVWTLVDIMPNGSGFVVPSQAKEKLRSKNSDKANSRFEYNSPWARIKLVQSAACDLRSYLEGDIHKTQSTFDRTKFLFENNIYNDDALRELSESTGTLAKESAHLQGLRFACIDAGYDSIYVCTNQNFILICSKSLKPKKFRKILINESRFLFPTSLRLLTIEDFLAVGLSNGSVMLVNCNQKNVHPKTKKHEDNLKSETIAATPQTLESFDVNLESGKSCAIQNIILNEKRPFDLYQETESYYRPATTSSLNTNKQKPFKSRIFDQQLLLSGSMLRKNLIKSLELSSNGWRLFALSDGEIRCYDFFLDREATSDELLSFNSKDIKVLNVAAAKTTNTQQNLILLTNDNVVQIHELNQ